MIQIVDSPKLNQIGADRFSLSKSWYDRADSDVKQLKNNVYNCFFHIWKGTPTSERMWATYNDDISKLRGKGYTNAHVIFNKKASNEYRDRTALAYCANIYMNVNEKAFYTSRGVDVDEDTYALSILVQWIWRSAIRDGKPIKLYIPSRRMRELLLGWIESTYQGGVSHA